MTLAQENSILSLIGTDPDGLLPIEIQKLMFIFSQEECQTPLYDFIPYQQGCYSPTLAAEREPKEYDGCIDLVVCGHEVMLKGVRGIVKIRNCREVGKR